MTNTKIYTGTQATGFTTVNNGISETKYNEQNARRDGVIKNSLPTWALACGRSNK